MEEGGVGRGGRGEERDVLRTCRDGEALRSEEEEDGGVREMEWRTGGRKMEWYVQRSGDYGKVECY